MSLPATIAEFAPDAGENGVGLAIRLVDGRYLFFLAGRRHHCPPGELFYAGIGGHREPGESWTACAHREAMEELGASLEIRSASATWFVLRQGDARTIELADRPRPLALYEMIHPPHAPRAGKPYPIVIYEAGLLGEPDDLPPDEVAGLIALTTRQVVLGLRRKPTLAQLLREGASLIAAVAPIDPGTRLYPLGTAVALARILSAGSGASPGVA